MASIMNKISNYIVKKLKKYQDKMAAKAEIAEAEAEEAESNVRAVKARARIAYANARAAEAEAEAAESHWRAAAAKAEVAAQSSTKKAEAAFIELLARKRQMQMDMETAVENHTQQLIAEMKKRGLALPQVISTNKTFKVTECTLFETAEEAARRKRFDEEMEFSYRY
jgi:hypothetical protein